MYSGAKGSKVKDALTECVASKAFRDTEQFAVICEVLLHKGFWDLLWHVCKAMHTFRHLLHLDGMMIGGLDRMK